MINQEETEGAFSDYFGFDMRTLGIFSGLVVGVVVVVTGIYIAIFGFDSWKSSMSQAGSLMLSNLNTPNAAAGTAPAPAGTVTPAPAAPAPPAARSGAQYVCPTCGAAGLPQWSPNGTPLCPRCGGVMVVTGNTGGNARLAARP